MADYVGEGRIAFVEWPEEAGAELQGACMRVTLTHLGGDGRRIEVEAIERDEQALAAAQGSASRESERPRRAEAGR